MKRYFLVVASSAVAFGTILGSGCSDKPNVTGSMDEVGVKGVVRVRGKAVADGSVTFRSSNVNRPKAETREFPIAKDGTYSGKAYVGTNFVDVSSKELLKPANRVLLENERMVTIPSTDSTLDIDIPQVAAPAAP